MEMKYWKNRPGPTAKELTVDSDYIPPYKPISQHLHDLEILRLKHKEDYDKNTVIVTSHTFSKTQNFQNIVIEDSNVIANIYGDHPLITVYGNDVDLKVHCSDSSAIIIVYGRSCYVCVEGNYVSVDTFGAYSTIEIQGDYNRVNANTHHAFVRMTGTKNVVKGWELTNVWLETPIWLYNNEKKSSEKDWLTRSLIIDGNVIKADKYYTLTENGRTLRVPNGVDSYYVDRYFNG